MKSLISKLEAATEGSRELDAEVAQIIGWRVNDFTVAADENAFVPYDVLFERHVPPYTTSIDAALTLAGEQWMAALLYALGRAAEYFVSFADRNGHIRKKVILWCCIAALKARAA